MKAFLVALACCLVSNSAAVAEQTPIDYEGMVDEVIHEIKQIGIQAALALEQQYDEILLEPLQQVEAALQTIEERKEDSEECVVAQEPAITIAVDNMHDELNMCGAVAAKTSASIMSDVNAATQQLLFDGYDVARTYQKCKSYKNIVLKSSCYARLSIKATLYLTSARRSIKTIRESTNQRIPAVFAEADVCTHNAADKAVLQLDHVNANIDACVVKGNGYENSK